jgi:hypothetical protein
VLRVPRGKPDSGVRFPTRFVPRGGPRARWERDRSGSHAGSRTLGSVFPRREDSGAAPSAPGRGCSDSHAESGLSDPFSHGGVPGRLPCSGELGGSGSHGGVPGRRPPCPRGLGGSGSHAGTRMLISVFPRGSVTCRGMDLEPVGGVSAPVPTWETGLWDPFSHGGVPGWRPRGRGASGPPVPTAECPDGSRARGSSVAPVPTRETGLWDPFSHTGKARAPSPVLPGRGFSDSPARSGPRAAEVERGAAMLWMRCAEASSDRGTGTPR